MAAFRKECEEKNRLCWTDQKAEATQGTRRTREQQYWPDMLGKMKNLVVMLLFSDHVDRELPTVDDVEIMCNHEGPHPLAPTGSIRDVFLKSSYGQLDITSTVYTWVTLPNTEKYYANDNYGLTCLIGEALHYALDQLEADPDFNFTEFDRDDNGWIDAIGFVYSGYSASNMEIDQYGAEAIDRIWPHKGSLCEGGNFAPWKSEKTGVKVSRYHVSSVVWGEKGNELNHIGSMAHETGHFLGIGDLYDLTDDGDWFSDDDELVIFADAGYGIGNYALMANNWGFDNTQHYPPHATAWTRIQLGWDNATVITEPGTYSIAAAELQADDEDNTDDPKIYRIDAGYPEGEYLLIENRQPLHFDGDMPQGGLVIYHIDETAEFSRQGWPGQDEIDDKGGVKWPQNGKHYRIAILAADGAYDLELDVNRGDGNDVFHAGSTTEIGPSEDVHTGPFPNTDAYQGGNVYGTGNRIYDIGPSGSIMTFKYEQTQDPTESSTPASDSGTVPSMSTSLFATFLCGLLSSAWD
mmetsp:Transcript_5770/g.10001  ORF Transcript_5770/g.10001 Transcript_5770/m.10001 type:complete len:522 (-) Transcript_5770:284-1849(-)